MPRFDGTSAPAAATSSAPKISLSLGSSRKVAPPPALKTKRPHALLDDDDNEEETTRHEAIVEFGAPSKSNGSRKEPERVIQSLPNRDWQEDMRRKRQKSGIPSRDQIAVSNGAAPEIVEASKQYGLTFRERSTSPTDETSEAVAQDAPVPQPAQRRTADEEALDALTGKVQTQQTIIRPQSPQNEDDAFQQQYAQAPDVATLDEYTATPVEGFGAAILRGYLAPGETLESRMEKGKSNSRKIERRPGLLGIGAKDTGQGVELGAWAPKRGGKKGKEEISYNPLARKNRKTGEMLTDEELRKKLEQQQLAEHAPKSSGSQRHIDSDYEQRREERNGHRHDRVDDRSSSRKERHRLEDRYRDADRNVYSSSSSRRQRDASVDRGDRKMRDEKYDKYDRREKERTRDRDDRRHGHGGSSRHDHRQRDRSR